MKIKKGEKKWFFSSLFVSILCIVSIVSQLVNGDIAFFRMLLDILMLIVMLSTTIKFVEFKK